MQLNIIKIKLIVFVCICETSISSGQVLNGNNEFLKKKCIAHLVYGYNLKVHNQISKLKNFNSNVHPSIVYTNILK